MEYWLSLKKKMTSSENTYNILTPGPYVLPINFLNASSRFPKFMFCKITSYLFWRNKYLPK